MKLYLNESKYLHISIISFDNVLTFFKLDTSSCVHVQIMAQVEKSTEMIMLPSAVWEMASVSICHCFRPTAVDTTGPDGFDLLLGSL